jgi:hypothetical protein
MANDRSTKNYFNYFHHHYYPFIKPIVNPMDILLVSGMPKFDIIAANAATFELSLIVLVAASATAVIVPLSGNSGHVVVPKDWIGKEVIVKIKQE